MKQKSKKALFGSLDQMIRKNAKKIENFLKQKEKREIFLESEI